MQELGLVKGPEALRDGLIRVVFYEDVRGMFSIKGVKAHWPDGFNACFCLELGSG